MNLQHILKPIFSFVWRKRLVDYKLIKVTGWRSCLMDSKYGQRVRATFIFSGHPHLDKYAGIFVRENDTMTRRPRDPNDTSKI